MDGNNTKLPPLPPSDATSLTRNHYDGFYRIGAKEFWAENEVSSNEVKDFVKCDHYFIGTSDGVTCERCHAGWIGPLTAKEGKLYVDGKPFAMS